MFQKIITQNNINFFFTNPKKIFEEFNSKYICFLLINSILTIISTIFSYSVNNKVIDEFIQQITNTSVANNLVVFKFCLTQIIIMLIILYFNIFITSIFYFFILKSIFKIKCKLKQIISIYSLCYITFSIGQVLKSIYIYFTDKLIIFDNFELNLLFHSTDIFIIWKFILFFIGITNIFSISKKKGFFITLLLYLFSVILNIL